MGVEWPLFNRTQKMVGTIDNVKLTIRHFLYSVAECQTDWINVKTRFPKFCFTILLLWLFLQDKVFVIQKYWLWTGKVHKNYNFISLHRNLMTDNLGVLFLSALHSVHWNNFDIQEKMFFLYGEDQCFSTSKMCYIINP